MEKPHVENAVSYKSSKMNTNTTGQITKVPNKLWYVHVDGAFDTMWGTRDLARTQKETLKSSGFANSRITIGSSELTVGPYTRDSHS